MTTATSYRYLFCDLLTNVVLGELRLTGVEFDEKLNEIGAFKARLLLSAIDTAKLNVFNCTIPDKCALYIDRGGQIVWGGVITSRFFKSKDQTMRLTGEEFLYYYGKRLITTDTIFANQDQLFVAYTLFENAASAPNGNIGCLYNTEPDGYAGSMPTGTSGVLISQTYYAYEQKTVLQAIRDLAKVHNGFDFVIDCFYDASNNPVKAFNTYYPRRGLAYTSRPNACVFELPAGNVVDYEYPEDGTLTANKITAVGAGSNEGKLIASASDAAKLAAGWALLEDSISDPSITDSALLTNLAQGRVTAVSTPPVTMTVIVNPNQDPVFGSYEVGDDVRVRIKDPMFPTGFDQIYRIIAMAVVAGETSAERITLTLAQNTGV